MLLPLIVINAKTFVANGLVLLRIEKWFVSNHFRDGLGVGLAPIANHLMLQGRVDSHILIVGKGVGRAPCDEGGRTE